MGIIQRYRKARLIFIAFKFHPRGGSTVSANHYHHYWSGKGEIVEKISLDSRFGIIRVVLAFFFGKKVVMNGLYCFYFWELILFTWLRKDVVIYLHESEDALKEFQSNAPRRFGFLTRLFRRNKIACISHLQEQYIRHHLGARKTHLVYNTLPVISKLNSNPDQVRILMAGFLMPRKGVSFYSELADYAHRRQPDWKFYWIGDGDTSGLYMSENVVWLGYQSNPHYYYEKIDVFFLSSVDEPLGLVCAEALMHHKKCVVYRNTGFAELIEEIPGCSIYDEYTTEKAYQALLDVIDQPLDTHRVNDVLASVFAVEKFSERFDHWLGIR